MYNRQLDIFDDDNMKLFWKVADTFPAFESFELEYKSAAGGFPKDFWKTYSAFANTEGGFIVLGVKEKSGKFQIEGLDKDLIHHHKKIFWDNANNLNTVSVNLLQESDVQILDYDGVDLLVFRIPSAIRTQKPVFLTRNPFGNTYKRNYEGDYGCSAEEVRRMLADADQKLHQDSRILEGFGFDDLDKDALKKYRQLFANVKPSHPWLALADKEFLEKLGGFRKDRVTKKEGLTLASLLMFGKYESIIDQECSPNFFPDFREHLSNVEDTRWSDRIYPDGTWECNLFNFYLKVWPKLSSSLPKPFLLKEGVRKDETPAHVALRESFINALIHSDFTAPGNIVIEHHKDHFSFLNPGTLLVSLHQYYEGGISECRNPSLQKMFLMIGTAEKAGSGVNKIMSGWEYAHWRRPFLRIETQPDRLILELPMFSILPDNTLEMLKSKFGNQIDRMGKNELTILATCAIEGEISNNRLQYLLDLHRTDITSLLQDLSKSGFLVSENRGRWTTYHLNSDYVEEPIPKVDTSKVDTSKVDTSKVDTSKVKSKKLSTEELQGLIMKVCSEEFRTLEEVSLIIGKSVSYLKNKVFPKMIESGLLERLHPTINHPHQAYRAIPS
jgi:predicted HTH transcriptional regulator